MGAEVWAPIGAVVTAIVTTLIARWQLPKIRAEARKLGAEASQSEWQLLSGKVAWLTAEVGRQDEKIRQLEQLAEERGDREKALERENKGLRVKVRRLEKRVGELEAILKIEPLPPGMKAALERLDRID